VKPFNLDDGVLNQEDSGQDKKSSSDAASPEKSEAASSKSSAIFKPLMLKFELCKNFMEKGDCKYGPRCLFAHGEHEMFRRKTKNEEITTAPEDTTQESTQHDII
jgi:hypothetical protein